MKSSDQIKAEIAAYARQLAEESSNFSWEDHESPFAAIEARAAEYGDMIAREFAVHKVRIENETPPPDEDCCCPDCGQRTDVKKVRKRKLQTIRGPIEISEPEHYCKKCRRAFFPSDEMDRR